MLTYHRPHWGARFAGALCALGAIAILTQDVLTTHAVTIDHGLQILIIILTIAIGHLAARELRQVRILTGLPLALVAAMASFWCVYQTAGRTAASHERAMSDAAEAARLRPAAVARLEANVKMLEEERRAYAKQCASGDGPKCQGIRKSLEVYTDAVNGSQLEVQRLAPKPVGSSAHALAAILAIMPGVTATREQIAQWLLLLDPLGPSLIFELGAMLCFGVRGAPVSMPPPAAIALAAEEEPEPDPAYALPPPTRSERQQREDATREFVAAYVARHGRPPRHREVMDATGLPRATASRYLARAVG